MNMKLRSFLNLLFWLILLSATLVSCAPVPESPLSLASFSENSVSVSLSLERDAKGQDFLSATFTPPSGYHLYSKDIPKLGVSGMGRPTLIELTPSSHLRAIGPLTESVSAGTSGYGPQGLLIYPAGPVTLRLSVKLPAGKSWVNDEIRVSFMTCNASQCKPPVEKIVAIRLPGAALFNKQSSKGNENE
jgi:hypothetical protein